jgi:hypothetical protein
MAVREQSTVFQDAFKVVTICEHKFYILKHNFVDRNILHNDLYLMIWIKLKCNFSVGFCLFPISVCRPGRRRTTKLQNAFPRRLNIYRNRGCNCRGLFGSHSQSFLNYKKTPENFNLSAFSLKNFNFWVLAAYCGNAAEIIHIHIYI